MQATVEYVELKWMEWIVKRNYIHSDILLEATVRTIKRKTTIFFFLKAESMERFELKVHLPFVRMFPGWPISEDIRQPQSK